MASHWYKFQTLLCSFVFKWDTWSQISVGDDLDRTTTPYFGQKCAITHLVESWYDASTLTTMSWRQPPSSKRIDVYSNSKDQNE